MKILNILLVGCGNMGTSHAKAYQAHPGFRIVGVVSRNQETREKLARLLGGVSSFSSYQEALAATSPDCVSINTYPDSHAEYACQALSHGCHVFLEKPLATTVAAAEKVVAMAKQAQRKLVVGYILRHHPSWIKFIEIAQSLGKPLVMRMNLNQQSSGLPWETHLKLMESTPPIVDCGVHYVDVMCQMTRAKPVKVSAIGARLSDRLPAHMYNYGQLQVTFKDGSIGWYEAGWGPMMSETAFFIKDVIGPKGSISITAKSAGGENQSDNVNAHTKREQLKLHHATLDHQGRFTKSDELIDMTDEPDHDELCAREQRYFYKAITEEIDLIDHMNDAINSLRIVLAANRSIRTGKTIHL